MAFPVPPRSHGAEIVKVVVGRPESSRDYFVHKSLLCKASPYFSAALSGKFKEASDNRLVPSKEHPLAFEVLYHYLYTGQVQPADFYIHDKTPEDVLWLRMIQIADLTMIQPLLHISYERLRILFSDPQLVPSSTFINKLYDTDTPQVKIQDYIVAHTVHANHDNNSKDWREWAAIYRSQPDYAVAVAIHQAQITSEIFDGCKTHPNSHASFNKDVIFPQPNVKPEETKEEAEAQNDE